MESQNVTLRPSPDALLNPRRDATFKTLFTDNSDEARIALKSFLEAFLDAKVSNIELRPNETSIESLSDKIENLTVREKWSKFLLYADKKDKSDFVKRLCESEEGIMAAQVTLAKISEDEANWLREMAIDKWERDHITGIHAAERRGAREARKEIARNLLLTDISIDIISKSVGLSIDEITKLQEETPV